MQWLKNYLVRRREAQEKRDAELKKERQELEERSKYVEYMETRLGKLERSPLCVHDYSQEKGVAYETIQGTSPVRLSRLTYSSWECDFTVANMDLVRRYEELFERGMVALVQYNRQERTGIPVKIKSSH